MRKVCEGPNCHDEYEAKRAAARYCSARCRKRASREPKAGAKGDDAQVIELPPTRAPNLYDATLRELEAAEVADTALGRNALILADRLDRGYRETGASLAALDRSFRAALAAATNSVEEAEDELDDIQRDPFTVISGGRI